MVVEDGQRFEPRVALRGDRRLGRRARRRQPPPAIGGAMSRNRGQPAPEGGRFAQLGDALQGRHEHVLHHVIHLGSRDAGQHHAVHHPCKALIELGKGVPVAGLRASDQSDEVRHGWCLGRSRCARHRDLQGKDGGDGHLLTSTVPAITCGLCRKTFESGPEHCPYCHLRVPGAPLRPAATKRAAPQRLSPRGRSSSSRTSSAAASRPAKPAGQCPACSHDITTQDTCVQVVSLARQSVTRARTRAGNE